MSINGFLSKWKEFVVKMNDKGVPVPMVRDPNTQEGSVSLTLVAVSSLLVVVGIVGKWSGRLGGVDINNALTFFYASSTLYFGHTWVHKDNGKEDKISKSDDPDAK